MTIALALPLAAALPAVRALARETGADDRVAASGIEVLVSLTSPARVAEVKRRLTGLGATTVRTPRGDLLVASVPSARLSALLRGARTVSGVSAVGLQGRVRAQAVPPEDPAYGDVDGQRIALGDALVYPHAVDLEPAWRQAFLGPDHAADLSRAGVHIALVDSGVSAYWREDTGRIVPVKDYVDGDAFTADSFGHGTRVASVIAAKSDNRFGIAGTAGDSPVTVEVYRVLDEYGVGTTEDTLRAIMDAADRGCRIINCSLGEPLEGADPETLQTRDLYEQAVSYASSKGAIVVAAAGNNGGAVLYPAAAADAVAVGSIDPRTGLRAAGSAFGPQLDVVAPGERSWNVTAEGDVLRSSGTSFAAPVVTGSFGLLWSLLPALPAQTLRDAVLSTAADYPSSAPDGPDAYYGNGKLDVWAAYRRLMSTVPEQADVTLAASGADGFWTTLSWTPAAGRSVYYRYGCVGGPEFRTTSTSARLFLESDGRHTVYVKEYCTDRWPNSTLATATVTVGTGLPPLQVRRHSGADRYRAAIAMSAAAYPGTASAVVIASGENWPDALTAGGLAYAARGPLLLTRTAWLPIAVRDEVTRLRPQRLYVVGGSSAVSADVLERLEELVGDGRVIRVAGADRYETARAVGARVRDLRGASSRATAVVASGERFADALSAGAYAARAGYPILLTRRDVLPPVTRDALAEFGIARTIVAGGPSSVSDRIAARLPGRVRIGGADRYDTSRLFLAFAVKDGVLRGERIALATGRRYPDALAAAPLVAGGQGGVLLTEGLDRETRSFLDARKLQLRGITFLGGPASLSAEFERALVTRLRTP